MSSNNLKETPQPLQSQESGLFHSKSEVQDFYDNFSRWYDQAEKNTDQPLRNKGLETLDVQPGQTLLEVGFGTGESLIRMAQQTGKAGKVYGIDLSNGMRQITQHRLEELDLMQRVELQTGDACTLLSSFPPKYFDGIFMSFTLELLDQDEIHSLLKECHRVLKPSGKLVVVAMANKRDEPTPEWTTQIYDWLSKNFPSKVNCKPIWLWRLAEESDFNVRKLVLAMMYNLPVDILLATPK